MTPTTFEELPTWEPMRRRRIVLRTPGPERAKHRIPRPTRVATNIDWNCWVLTAAGHTYLEDTP